MGRLSQTLTDRAMLQKIPLGVHFDLTNRCNEHCVHCYRVVEERPELTTTEVSSIIEQLANAGTLYLTFSGGEVFLRKDLFPIIAHARRLRFDVRLKTNGLLITEHTSRDLSELGVSQVDISIYSLEPSIHDGITLVPGSLERSLKAALALRDNGIRVRLNCPLMRHSVEGHRELIEWGQSHGLKVTFDPTITPKNDGDRTPLQLRITSEQYRQVLRHPYFRMPDVTPDPSSSAPPPSPADLLPCGASHSSCYISPYGDVFPCVQMPIPCGNLRDQPFSEIWQLSKEMLRVRSIRKQDLSRCPTCSVSEHCFRCPGQAYLEGGSLTAPSTASCQRALVRAVLSETYTMKEVYDGATSRFFRHTTAGLDAPQQETLRTTGLGGGGNL